MTHAFPLIFPMSGGAGGGGGGGTPGGSNGQAQWNNGGVFDGFGNVTASSFDVDRRIAATYATDSVLRDAFTSFPTTASRNDADFVSGHTFIPVVSMSVSQLGRFYAAGNTQNHTVAIWERVSGTLITSGLVLAASSSDANGFKYVSVSPVTLDPAKEYVIASQEFAAGDTWKDAWDSVNYYSPYVARTGFGYRAVSSLAIPTVFGTGTIVYNACTFKFTPNVVGQISAAYDSNNFLAMISNSNGTGSLVTNNNDKTVSIFNSLGIGIGTVSSGFKAEIAGGLRATGSVPIRTMSASGTANSDMLSVGVNALSSQNAICVRGGYILIESGSGADVLLNYDNPSKNVGIGSIFTNTKLGALVDVATKKGYVLRLAASQSATGLEVQDSSGVPFFTLTGAGKVVLANSPNLSFSNSGAAAPGTGSAGQKIQLFGTAGTIAATDYALGIESGAMWFTSNGAYRFYVGGTALLDISSTGTSLFRTTSTTGAPIIARMAASMTGNGLEVQNSSGTTLFNVGGTGNVNFTNTTGTVYANWDATSRVFYAGGDAFAVLTGDGTTRLYNNGKLVWNNGATASSGTPDIGLARNAAGVVEINNGTAGTFRDLKLRNLEFSAGNIATDTTTGTKIGTATTQKLSMWNATPIVQPTTAGAAATFVANTSLIANDTATFDGYTIGQVVKALRNIGILA